MSSVIPAHMPTPDATALGTKYNRVNRPYGWMPDAKGELIPVEQERKALHIMRDKRMSGYSNGMIADELNAQGFLTARHKPWTDASVSHVLRRQADKPSYLRAAEGATTDDENVTLYAPEFSTKTIHHEDGTTVERFSGFPLDHIAISEAEIGALEQLDAAQRGLVERGRAQRSDSAAFASLDMGEGPAMLPEPQSSVLKRAVRARYASVGEALDAIPKGAAPEAKQSIRIIVNALIEELSLIRCQNAHLRNRLAEVTGGDEEEKLAALKALHDRQNAILRQWGWAKAQGL